MKNLHTLLRRIRAVSSLPIVLMLASSSVLADCIPASADTFASAVIPATCITAEGMPDSRRNFTYELIAQSENDPMPAGSENGIKTVHMKRSGDIDFGRITYSRPDIYCYTLKESSREWGGFRRDHNVYTAQVVVGAEKDVSVVFKNSKGEKTERVEFVNRYSPGKRAGQKAPKTGDGIRVLAASAAALISSAVLLIILIRRRRGNE